MNKDYGNNCIIAGTPARQIGQVPITEDGNVKLKYFVDEEGSINGNTDYKTIL